MPDLIDLLPMVAMLTVIGGLAGVLAGLLGVGGGIVLVPALYYAFTYLGYDSPQLMQVCIATSLGTILVTSGRSMRTHNARGATDMTVLKTWAPGIVIGAGVGVLVAARLRSEELQAIFGVLGVVVGLYMAFGRAHWRLGDRMPGLVTRSVLSPVIGFLSVLMGIGGGSFGVPLMTLYNMPIHRAVGTASGLGLVIAVPSVLGFLLVDVAEAPPLTLGAINLPAFALVMVATYVTTPYGVALAHRMDPKPLKRVFAVFITLVALNMLRKVVLA
ncbi:MAG: sulfite exporter TauE/SafE family protein [Rhodobacterales bacterium]|nr:sulfite exporter TauE/SafE family protein [Rhodobacterales bacterium]